MKGQSDDDRVDGHDRPVEVRRTLLTVASGSDDQADKLSGIALAGSADIGKWLFASLLTINGAGAALVANKAGFGPSVALVFFGVGIVLTVLAGMLFWLALLFLGLSRYASQTDATYEKIIVYCSLFGALGWLLALGCFFAGGSSLLADVATAVP